LQLRFLQTLSEVATEKNSTIVFPVPIDLIRLFAPQAFEGNGGAASGDRPRVRVGAAASTPLAPAEAEPPSREGTVS
jgi:hypothetical protein